MAGLGIFLCAPLAVPLQAQNQGTYLILDFSGPDAAPALRELDLIEAGGTDPTEAKSAPEPRADEGATAAPTGFSGSRFGAMDVTGGTGTFVDAPIFEPAPPVGDSAPSGSFQNSSFGKPDGAEGTEESSFFDEAAFTNPDFGGN